jgi:mannose-6-phosphate isomerase-like protein (cupin superfamily)
MTLAPGDSESGPDNRHRGADQWLFVESGSGVAIVNRRRTNLRAGSLVLIERGDRHEIRNTGRRRQTQQTQSRECARRAACLAGTST